MKTRFKKPLIFTLILLPVCIIGVYYAVLMSVSTIESSFLEEAIAQVGSRELVIVLSTIQPVILACLCAFFGYILSEKIGLMRPLRLETKPLLCTLAVSLIGGAVFSLDAWTFAKWIPQVGYEGAGSFDLTTWLASILYGGVIEEVMMRLFLMSLLVFLARKIFFRNEQTTPRGVLIGANVAAALVFAALHIPATVMTFGAFTPLMALRCFLLNGAFGLIFGWLYRKHGIQYAMISHALFHIVSRTIWLIAF